MSCCNNLFLTSWKKTYTVYSVLDYSKFLIIPREIIMSQHEFHDINRSLFLLILCKCACTESAFCSFQSFVFFLSSLMLLCRCCMLGEGLKLEKKTFSLGVLRPAQLEGSVCWRHTGFDVMVWDTSYISPHTEEALVVTSATGLLTHAAQMIAKRTCGQSLFQAQSKCQKATWSNGPFSLLR